MNFCCSSLLLLVVALVSGLVSVQSTASGGGTGDIENLRVLVSGTCDRRVALNISWDTTPSKNDLHFELQLTLVKNQTTEKCRQNSTVVLTVNTTRTELEILPNTRRDHPLLDCEYTLSVTAHPSRQTAEMKFEATVVDATVQQWCSATLDPQSGHYNAAYMWSLGDAGCAAVARIQQFKASLTKSLSSNVVSSFSLAPAAQSAGAYQWNVPDLVPVSSGLYTFMLEVVYTDNSSKVVAPLCNVSAPPAPPEPITNISVVEFTVPDHRHAKLVVQWTAPVPNGNLTEYQLWLGKRELRPQEIIDTSQLVVDKTFMPSMTSTTENFITPLQVDTLFLQVRSTNDICKGLQDPCYSNWSVPILLDNQLCYLPKGHNLTAPSQSERVTTNTAQCLAACIDEFAANKLSQSVWPTVSREELTCSELSMVTECQRGCLTFASDTTLEKVYCEDNCYTECKTQCGNRLECPSSVNNGCNQICRYSQCEVGCTAHKSIASSTGGPFLESNGLYLESAESRAGGQFLMVANQSSQHQSTVMVDHTFVFKITDEEGVNYYHWLSSLDEALDLRFFSCKNVNVSIAIINRNGTSNFTNPMRVFVYGETRLPNQLHRANITYSAREDLRPGFSKHAILNISWIRQEGFRYLTHYEITVGQRARNCGGRRNFIVGRNATSLIIESDTPAQLPKFDCKYAIRIVAMPLLDGRLPLEKRITNLRETEPRRVLDIECNHFQLPNGLIVVNVTWTIPSDSATLESISRFVIWEHYFPDKNIEIGRTFGFGKEVSYQRGELTYTWPTHTYPRTVSNQRVFRIWVNAQFHRRRFTYRLQPDPAFCFINTTSNPPSVISNNSIIVQVHEFSDRLINVSISWQLPETTYGTIDEYDVVISETPLDVSNATIPLDSFMKKGNSNVTGVVRRLLVATSCLYVQVRSHNEYDRFSDWSEPFLLAKSPDSCITVSPSPTPSPSPSLSHSSTFSLPVSVLPSLKPEMTSATAVYIVLGVAAGIVIAFIVTALLVCGCYFRHKKIDLIRALEGPDPDNIFIGKKSSDSFRKQNPYALKVDQWEFSPTDIVIENEMSEGFFGKVYKGVVKGPLENPKLKPSLRNAINVPVAIKMLKGSCTGVERKDFLNEIDIMKIIATGNNPHVVSLVGAVTIQEPIALLTLVVKYGDLLSYLKYFQMLITSAIKNQGNNNKINAPLKQGFAAESDSRYNGLGELQSNDLLSFAYQIASGMEFLASLSIIHRDLACRNILIGEDKSLKISDFGMSRVIAADDVYVKSNRGRLPWKWMAIESIAMRDFTAASDVWSYGVVLWEIATLGGHPYPSISNIDLLEHLQSGGRLDKPQNCTTEVYDVMLQCWSEEPKERPNFSQVRATFDSLISAQQGDAVSYIDLMTLDLEQPYYSKLPTEDSDEFMIITGQEMPYDKDKNSTEAYNHLAELEEESAPSKLQAEMIKGEGEHSSYDHLEMEDKYPSYDHLPEVGISNLAYRDSDSSSPSRETPEKIHD